jgi:peptidoglycan/xylan/chitin deacetylase (PgdA/CDA1 family)
MPRLRALSLSFLLATSLPTFAQENTTVVIPLENAGFEGGLEGWTSEPGEQGFAKDLPESAMLGAKGLRVVSQEAERFSLTSSPVPVKVGETYTVTFWGGLGGTTEKPGEGVSVKMEFRDGAGQRLKEDMAKIRKWPGVQVKGDTYANTYLLAAAAPAGATTLRLVLSSAGKAPVGPVDLDDFVIKQLGDEVKPQIAPGQGHPIPPHDAGRVQAMEEEVAANPYRGKAAPKIVLKLDDFGATKDGGVHPRWLKVADFCRERNVKVTFGIIATRMLDDAPKYATWVNEQRDAGRIEFWCHGWDHGERKEGEKRIQEFSGETLEYQTQHLIDANKLAKDKLGFEYTSFGAPFNAIDDNTVKALAQVPSIKVWMYGPSPAKAKESGKIVLERSAVSIESPTLIPNYADFVEAYAHNRGADYFVMQGHPAGWGEDRWEQFTKIVEFLIAQKAEFVFASDFAK